MKNSVLFFLIPLMLSLIVLSCDSENSDVIYNFKKFPDEVTLEGTNTKLNDSINMNPHKAVKTDSFIFVLPRSDYPLHIFNRNDFSYIKAAGKIGKGPGEINIGDDIFVNHKNDELWIIDVAKQKIAQFPIDSILKNSDYLFQKAKEIPVNLQAAGKGHFIDDSTLILHLIHKDGIFFVHRDGKLIDTIGNIPEKKENYGKEIHHLTNYLTKGAYIPSKKRAVAAYHHYDIIELYDIASGEKLRKIVGPDNIEPVLTSGGIVHTSKSSGAYYTVKTDNKYIYLSYLGNRMLKKSDDSEYGVKAAYPSQIHVHDFNGKPVMKIELDREFKTFFIDRKKEQIITLGAEKDPEEGLFRIYEYPEKL